MLYIPAEIYRNVGRTCSIHLHCPRVVQMSWGQMLVTCFYLAVLICLNFNPEEGGCKCLPNCRWRCAVPHSTKPYFLFIAVNSEDDWAINACNTAPSVLEEIVRSRGLGMGGCSDVYIFEMTSTYVRIYRVITSAVQNPYTHLHHRGYRRTGRKLRI